MFPVTSIRQALFRYMQITPILEKKPSSKSNDASKGESQAYLEENACGWNRHCVQESGNLLWINTFRVSTSVISIVHEEHMISIIRIMLNLQKVKAVRILDISSEIRTTYPKVERNEELESWTIKTSWNIEASTLPNSVWLRTTCLISFIQQSR